MSCVVYWYEVREHTSLQDLIYWSCSDCNTSVNYSSPLLAQRPDAVCG